MKVEKYNALYARIKAMSKEDRELIDPVCAALFEYQKRTHVDCVMPPLMTVNRVVGLAAIDLMVAFCRHVWEEE